MRAVIHSELPLPVPGILNAEVGDIAIAEPGRDDMLHHNGLGEAQVDMMGGASVRYCAPHPLWGITAAEQVVCGRSEVSTASCQVASRQKLVVVGEHSP